MGEGSSSLARDVGGDPASQNQALHFGRAAVGFVSLFLLIHLVGSFVTVTQTLTAGSVGAPGTIAEHLPVIAIMMTLLVALIGTVMGNLGRFPGLHIALLCTGVLLVLQAGQLAAQPIRTNASPSVILILMACLPTLLAVAVLWMRCRMWTTAVTNGGYSILIFSFGLAMVCLATGYLVHLLTTTRFPLHDLFPMIPATGAAVLLLVALLIVLAITPRRPFLFATVCVVVHTTLLYFGATTTPGRLTFPEPHIMSTVSLIAGAVFLMGSLFTASKLDRERSSGEMVFDDLPTATAAASDDPPVPTDVDGPIALGYHAPTPAALLIGLRDTVLKIVLAYLGLRFLVAVSIFIGFEPTDILRLALSRHAVSFIVFPAVLLGAAAMVLAALCGQHRFIMRSVITLGIAGAASMVSTLLRTSPDWLASLTHLVPIGIGCATLYAVRPRFHRMEAREALISPIAIWGTVIYIPLASGADLSRAATTVGLPDMVLVYVGGVALIMGLLVIGRVLAQSPAGHGHAVVVLTIVCLLVLTSRVAQLHPGLSMVGRVSHLVAAIAPCVLLIGLNVVARRVSMTRS